MYKCIRCLSRKPLTKRKCSTASMPEYYYIKRNRNDILKALSATLTDDSSLPMYKFYDDPYLYAHSDADKKHRMLAKESGRKTARWVRDEHSDCFNHQPDDPVIHKFLPTLKFDENSEVNEDILNNLITNLQVTDAISAYQKLKSEDLSSETLQSLLELASFFNCEDTIDDDWIEQKFYVPYEKNEGTSKRWKDGGLAEELFKELKDQTELKAYSAIIRGMCMHGQSERAWQLYQELLDQNISPDVEIFNSILSVISILQNDHDGRWQIITDTLSKMSELNIKPNIRTLNAIMKTLMYSSIMRSTKTRALGILSEFNRLNIKPSLATYFSIIRIFYVHNKYSYSPELFTNILNEIDGKELKIVDPMDTYFFHTAMESCRKDLNSIELAHRLHRIYEFGNNSSLIPSNQKEIAYFRHYLILSVSSMPIHDFMKIYERYVPSRFSPGREVIEAILNQVILYEAVELLPKLWSDCLMLAIERSSTLISTFLSTINKHDLENSSDDLKQKLANISYSIWTTVQTQKEQFINKVTWTGQMLGDCLSSLARCKDYGKCSEIVTELEANPTLLLGVLPEKSLNLFLQLALENSGFELALFVIKYASDSGLPEAEKMADIFKNSSASDESKKKLDFIIKKL